MSLISAQLKINGLEELLEELRDAPREIQSKAERIIRNATYSAAHHIRMTYERHRTPGPLKSNQRHLADNVVVRFQGSETGAAVGRVLVDAPHAHIFERGTAIRRWNNPPKNTGAAPAHHVVSKISSAKRRQMHEELRELLSAQGLKVTTHG